MPENAQDAQQAQPKRRRRAKSNSLHVMKELTGLMDQRTAILAQMRVKRMELAELEASLQQLGTEIQWRAGIFGLSQSAESNSIHFPAQPIAAPGAPYAALTPPIFRQPEPPASRDGINRGMADLSSLS